MRPTVAARWVVFVLVSQVITIGVFFGTPHLPFASSWLLANTRLGLLGSSLVTDLAEAATALSLYVLIARPLRVHVPIIGRRDDRTWSVMLGLSVLLAVVIVVWVRNPGLTLNSGWPLHWDFVVTGPKMLVVALCEEYVFRGVMLTLSVRRWGAVSGVLLTSLLFAAFHWEFLISPYRYLLPHLSFLLIQMTLLFITGLLLSYINLRSGALVWPIAVHWMWDYSPWNPATNIGDLVSTGIVFASGILAAEILHLHRTGRLFGLRLRAARDSQHPANSDTAHGAGDAEDA